MILAPFALKIPFWIKIGWPNVNWPLFGLKVRLALQKKFILFHLPLSSMS